MEEDKLEKRYKKAMKVINETSLPLFVEDSFEDIFLAYKQDEKVINEMAKYIDFDKMNFNCGMCVHDGCQEKCIIDYFRKRCK